MINLTPGHQFRSSLHKKILRTRVGLIIMASPESSQLGESR